MEKCPRGYPHLALFLASDRTFLQFRAFADVHCRLLLGLQNDIHGLSEQLDEMDRWDFDHGKEHKLESMKTDALLSPQDLEGRFYPAHLKQSRPEIFDALGAKVLRYGQYHPPSSSYQPQSICLMTSH